MFNYYAVKGKFGNKNVRGHILVAAGNGVVMLGPSTLKLKKRPLTLSEVSQRLETKRVPPIRLTATIGRRLEFKFRQETDPQQFVKRGVFLEMAKRCQETLEKKEGKG